MEPSGRQLKTSNTQNISPSPRPAARHAATASDAGSTRDADTLALRAYRQLRVDIIRGIRAPEERLRLEMLKTVYGIGPTPLREALQKLSADGLIIFEGNRGFMVAPLSVEEFEDLNTARTALEKEDTTIHCQG